MKRSQPSDAPDAPALKRLCDPTTATAAAPASQHHDGSHHAYYAQRQMKLDTQLGAERLVGTVESSIFKGMFVWVNGHTSPPFEVCGGARRCAFESRSSQLVPLSRGRRKFARRRRGDDEPTVPTRGVVPGVGGFVAVAAGTAALFRRRWRVGRTTTPHT